MKKLPPHIAVGRRRLALLILIALLLPALASLSFLYTYLDKPHGFFAGYALMLAISWFIPVLLGGILGYLMLRGKVWANSIWCFSLGLIGFLIFICSLVSLIVGGLQALPYLLFGCLLLFVVYQCTTSTKINDFYDYLKNTAEVDLIDEIGKA